MGDVDADGYPDGATGGGGGASDGNVAFYRGGPSGLTESGVTILESPREALGVFGFAVINGGDTDGDGYGELILGAENANLRYRGYVDEDGDGVNHNEDCDDFDADKYPGNPEVVGNNVDEGCDGLYECWADLVGDGYAPRDAAVVFSTEDCGGAGEALTCTVWDCDDADRARSPRADEAVNDGVDQDCDDRETCYRDEDADGYRPENWLIGSVDLDCEDPGVAGTGVPDGDCDDENPASYPGAPDLLADGVDQDGRGLGFVSVAAALVGLCRRRSARRSRGRRRLPVG